MAVRERLPRNSYEEWLEGQKVKRTGRKPEIRFPPDIFEVWLEEQVHPAKKKHK